MEKTKRKVAMAMLVCFGGGRIALAVVVIECWLRFEGREFKLLLLLVLVYCRSAALVELWCSRCVGEREHVWPGRNGNRVSFWPVFFSPLILGLGCSSVHWPVSGQTRYRTGGAAGRNCYVHSAGKGKRLQQRGKKWHLFLVGRKFGVRRWPPFLFLI